MMFGFVPFSHVGSLCPIWTCRRVVILYLCRGSIDANEQIFRSDSWCGHFCCLGGFIENGDLLAGYFWWFGLSYVSVRLIGDVLLSWESFGEGGFCKRFVDCFRMGFLMAQKRGHRLLFSKTTSHNYVNIKNKEWMAQAHSLVWKWRNGKGTRRKLILSWSVNSLWYAAKYI